MKIIMKFSTSKQLMVPSNDIGNLPSITITGGSKMDTNINHWTATVMKLTPEIAKEMLKMPSICVWKDCKCTCLLTNDLRLPKGWRWVAVYKKDPYDGEVDAALCPEHAAELGKFLTPIVGSRLFNI
jgi:hypothetical protein